jgi:hypothetical protein
MNSSCPYKYLFGMPEKGIHSYTLFGLSIVDTILTIIVAFITSFTTGLPFLLSFADWFFLGETLHYAFGTETRFLKLMGWKPKCD